MKNLVVLAASLSLLMPCGIAPVSAAIPAPSTVEELKADRVKSVSKRDPRAEDLITKALARAEKVKQ